MESHNKWSERITMLFLTMCVGYIFFIVPINLRDDSDGFTATCTVTKAYTQERRGTDLGGMTDIGLKGVFEGWNISAYVKTAQPGKKYLFHVSNRSPKKDQDFVTTRFEEIKE